MPEVTDRTIDGTEVMHIEHAYFPTDSPLGSHVELRRLSPEETTHRDDVIAVDNLGESADTVELFRSEIEALAEFAQRTDA